MNPYTLEDYARIQAAKPEKDYSQLLATIEALESTKAELAAEHAMTEALQAELRDVRGQFATQAERVKVLRGALEGTLRAAEGFMAAVRLDTGKAYPWAPWDFESEKARSALSATSEAPHE